VRFRLTFTDEAARILKALARRKDPKLKKVRKTLGLMETDLRHPALHTHEFTSLSGPNGEKVFESCVENRTPGAWRVFWFYGPERGVIRVLNIVQRQVCATASTLVVSEHRLDKGGGRAYGALPWRVLKQGLVAGDQDRLRFTIEERPEVGVAGVRWQCAGRTRFAHSCILGDGLEQCVNFALGEPMSRANLRSKQHATVLRQ